MSYQKIVVILSFFVSIAKTGATQNEKATLGVEIEKQDSIANPALNLTIYFTSQSDTAISILSEKALSDFFCRFGNVGIEFQKLEDSCFVTRSPDCAMPMLMETLPRRHLSKGEKVVYHFDIGKLLDRKEISSAVYMFWGHYRFRIFHSFKTIENKSAFVNTGWYYLNF